MTVNKLTPEEWKKVEDVFESALQRPPSERSAFLEVACEGDESLRNQVQTLLLSLERAGNFMEASALGVSLTDTVVEDTPSVIGQRLGSYRIVKEIGRGGMGAVYLATRADDEFQKEVAIKLIRRGMDTDFIVKRFRNERQILAGLDHPNVARLLDGGTTEDGLPYFVMEYVEGSPLYRYCDSKQLTVAERLKIFRRVCSAVHYAHQNHVIHRDLKPSNILVTAEGTPKLLDFGIAKLLNPELAHAPLDPTTAAVRLMTPEYASPEQVRGETLTVSSDVYALGVMLYELLTDHRPYRLKSHLAHEMARVICEEEPDLPSVAVNAIEVIGVDTDDPIEITPATVSKARSTTPEQLKRELAGSLDNIVLKAMNKEVSRRYRTVEEFSEDIRLYLEGRPVTAPSFFPSATRSHLSFEDPSTASRSIAVLPFQVLRVEEKSEEFLGMGLADAIITKLSNIQRIIVRPTSAVIKYFDGTHNILAAGHELNVGFVLDGRIQRAADRIRVTVQLVSVRDGQPVWAAKFDENYTDIFSVEDSISEQVAHALVPHLSGEERQLLLRRETENANAYQAFLKGRYLWNRFTPEDFNRAAEQFREAIALDPNYAQAHVGLADYYNWAAIFGLGSPKEYFPLAKSSAIRALEIDESLAEAHAALAFTNLCYDWDWVGAEQRFRRSLELNGNYGPAHQWYSNLLAAQGRFEEAINEVRRALEINPLSMMDRSMAGWTYYHARQYERAEREVRAALEIDRNFSNCYLMLGFIYERMGRYEDSVASLQRAGELMAGSVVPLWPLAYTFASSGKRTEAKAILDHVRQLSSQRYVSPYFIALIQTGLGEYDDAIGSLRKALDEKDEWLLWLGVEPKLDPLRSDPRFTAMLNEIGLRGDESSRALHFTGDQTADFISSSSDKLLSGSADLHRSTPTSSKAVLAVYKDHKRERAWLFGLGAVAMLLVAAFALYKFTRPGPSPFPDIQVEKLTAAGNIVHATISPDGKYLAFVMEEAGKQGLWARQTAIANNNRIIPTAAVEYRGLTFSKDGNYVYYVFKEPAAKHGTLARVPAFGGSVREIKKDVDSPVCFSPDMKRFAFIRSDSEKGEDLLMIANEDGSGEQQLATMKFPSHFSLRPAPAWSPDGKQVLVVTETTDDNGFFAKLSAFDVATRAETLMSSRRWLEISDVGWIPNSTGAIISAQDNSSPFYQLWLVDPARREERKLTNDLNDYLSVSLSVEPLSLLSVQRQTLTNIWIEYKGGPGDPVQATPLTSGAGRFFDLRWTADDKLIYASDASGNADIWEMAADGSNRTQLTAAAGRNYAPVASTDGKYVVFHSNRSGRWQIWRMNRDGSNPVALTEGKEESNWPAISPDGRWVYYEHIDGGSPKLWKIPMEGGTAARVFNTLALRPSVSPDGKLIAFWHKQEAPNAPWRIAVAPVEGDGPWRYLDVPQGLANGQSVIEFSPAGDTVTFIDFNNGMSRLISQPLDGSAPRVLTSITKDLFYSFSQARDGRLVMSRGIRTSDVTLITERK
jgi:serine/threonine protein kinase/Tol biopolymer transport system component/tetratricopeptide (TPR) repeat protein